jgi:hypothetical protein
MEPILHPEAARLDAALGPRRSVHAVRFRPTFSGKAY